MIAQAPSGSAQGDERETSLAGGVSSDIRIVHAPQGACVVKRALPKLRVRADWYADPARSTIEARGLQAIAALIGQAHVPRVLWIDEAGHRFAMELIGDRYENWKQKLLRGEVDLATAAAAGRLLGELHARSAAEAGLAQAFANVQPFVELRVRPYFERVAERNPALAAAVGEVVERILQSRNALVHGDYSPKNLLVDGGDVVVLDCEVAHWGDARFDVAFCIAHLLLKSFRRGAPSQRLLRAAHALLAEYVRAGAPLPDRECVRQLACLLLARLEGDSPVDYLDDLDVRSVKRCATDLLVRPPRHVEAAVVRVADVIA